MNRILPFAERHAAPVDDMALFVEALNDVLPAPVRKVLLVGVELYVPETRPLWLSPVEDLKLRQAGYDQQMQCQALDCSLVCSFTEEVEERWLQRLQDCRRPTSLKSLRQFAIQFKDKILNSPRLMPAGLDQSLVSLWEYTGLDDKRVFASLLWLQKMAGKRPHIVPLGRWKNDPGVYLVFWWGVPITVPAEQS